MIKIMLTGAGGMLGQECLSLWQQSGFDVVGLSRTELDIVDEKAVFAAVDKIKPDVIVHAAAYTAVDKAEEESDLCERVNVLGTENIAKAALKYDAIMCYISTDYVFDGSSPIAYDEEDVAAPINSYGRSKWLGEERVRELLVKYFIVRVSWLCGSYGRNFIEAILKKSAQVKELSVVNDQSGSPTFTYDVASNLLPLIATECYGTYHMVSKGVCTWYDFAQEILKQKKIKTPVVAISSSELGFAATRPANSVLKIDKLKKVLGETVMPAWQDGLDAYLKRRKD